MTHGDVALAILCKAPVAGAGKTRLCPPLTPAEAAGLSRCFIADVAAAAVAAHPAGAIAVYTPAGAEAAFDGVLPPGLPMLAQRGDDLGARMLNATADLLSAGWAGVCLIGSDVPTLPAASVAQALEALRRPGDRVVLGPVIDGGYCLIGLKQAHAALFEGVRWSTGQVLAQTRARVDALGAPLTVLPPWYDVDDGDSLRRLMGELCVGTAPLGPGGPAGADAPRTRRCLAGLMRGPGAPRFGLAAPPGQP